MKKAVVIIPCRWGSSRFPGKPLASLLGKPLIQHVYEHASTAKEAACVVVATDDDRIEQSVKAFGGEVMRTPLDARSGSDRAAELVDAFSSEIFINLQGDELLLNSMILDELIIAFQVSPPLQMGTIKQELSDWEEIMDPNVVKVVTDKEDFAIYFSRSPIPFERDASQKQNGGLTPIRYTYYKHLGIYIFERKTLKFFSSLPSGRLEMRERLEQLRALENGIPIKVWETKHKTLRIDTPSDLKSAEQILKKQYA